MTLRKFLRVLPAGVAAFAMAGCLEDPPPPRYVPEIEIFGKADTMVYIGDTLRFEVSHSPRSAKVTGYSWIFTKDDWMNPLRYDSVETTEPFLERVFRADQAGYHGIQVTLLGLERDWWSWPDFSGFRVRVDPGKPKLTGDSIGEFPFGSGNRIRVKASDPNGRIVKYHWSTKYGTFTDSTDLPEWSLPDSLLGGQSLYCRVRDEDGQVSDTLSKSLRFQPRGTYGSVRDALTGVSALAGGGFLVAGTTQSFDTRVGDAWLARIDGEGRLVSHATVKRSYAFGSKGTGWFNALAPGEAGVHLAVGAYRDSTHNDGLFALSDGQGKFLVQGFAEGNGHQEFHAATWLKSGAWLAVGSSVPNLNATDTTVGLLGFIRSDGGVASRTLSRGRYLTFHCVAPTADGNALVGATGMVNFSASTGYLYKVSPAGDSLWARPMDAAGFPILIPRALIACKAGGFALLATSSEGAVVQRLDEEGQVQWTRLLFKLAGESARPGGLAETPEGDFLAGLDLPYKSNPYSGLLLTRLDAQGVVRWTRRLGRYEDNVSAVASVPGGGFAVAGSLSNQSWLLRLAEDGKVMW